MDERKLSIDEQIERMKSQGITFDICGEADARRFLQSNTYYFKVKAYKNLYSNDNKEHVYKNLDFEYLKELSKIDMHLRRIILSMCLDIEHILKTRLVFDSTTNARTDGFDVVTKFLDGNYKVCKQIIDKAKGKNVSASLAADYYDSIEDKLKPIPVWAIVELISFGDFVDLYTLYYQEYSSQQNYCNYLGAIRYLRNASAHSNCLICSLKKQPGFSKTQAVLNALSHANNLINEQTRRNKMSVPVIHDFVTLLLVYNDLLNTPQNRSMKIRQMEEVRHFFLDDNGRLRKNKDYFLKNASLVEAYRFICSVLKLIENNEKNPRSKRLLSTK